MTRPWDLSTHTTIETEKKDVNDSNIKAQYNELEAQPVATHQESFEEEVNRVLNKARDGAGSSATQSLRDE